MEGIFKDAVGWGGNRLTVQQPDVRRRGKKRGGEWVRGFLKDKRQKIKDKSEEVPLRRADR